MPAKSKQQKMGSMVRKPAPRSTGARASVPRLSRTLVGGRTSSNTSTLPGAFVNTDMNRTVCSVVGPCKHPFLGIAGVRLRGVQPLSTIGMTNTVGDASTFSSGTLATAVSDGTGPAYILLSPDDFNGPLAAQANLHVKYVFRDIVVEYVSNCAQTQADSMVLAIAGDSSYSTPGYLPSTFSTARQLVPSITFPFRADRVQLHYHYDGMDTFYVARDTATTAGLRQTHQGAIVGYADKTQGNVASLGYMNVWYDIELYYPNSSQGVTLLGLSDDQKLLVRAYAQKLKEDSKHSSVLCQGGKKDEKSGTCHGLSAAGCDLKDVKSDPQRDVRGTPRVNTAAAPQVFDDYEVVNTAASDALRRLELSRSATTSIGVRKQQ